MVRETPDPFGEEWNGVSSDDLAKTIPGFGGEMPAQVMVAPVSRRFAHYHRQLYYDQAVEAAPVSR